MTEQSTSLSAADQRVATRAAQALADDYKTTADALRIQLAKARGHNGANVNTGVHPVHPEYGPCDGFEDGGACSVCVEEIEQLMKDRDAACAELKTRTQDYTRLIEEAQAIMRPQAVWEAYVEQIKQAVTFAFESVSQEQHAGAAFTNPLLAVSARIAIAWMDLEYPNEADKAPPQRAELDKKDELLTEALAYEVEHNGMLGEQPDRLRAALGLPPVAPLPITEAFAQLRELAGAVFDGIDAVAYVREIRGRGPCLCCAVGRCQPGCGCEPQGLNTTK